MGRGGRGHSEHHAINPATPTHGYFVLSPVSLVSRDQDGGPSILRKNKGLNSLIEK